MAAGPAAAIAIDLFAVRNKSLFGFGAVHSTPRISFDFETLAPANFALEIRLTQA